MHLNKSFACNVLSPVVSVGHMSMNSELLEPGSGVFYLRGDTKKSLIPTIWTTPSTLDCVAIQYEWCGHSHLYLDCILDCLMSPISHAESSLDHESHGPFSITRIWPTW